MNRYLALGLVAGLLAFSAAGLVAANGDGEGWGGEHGWGEHDWDEHSWRGLGYGHPFGGYGYGYGNFLGEWDD